MISSSGCQPWLSDNPAIPAGKHERLALLHHDQGLDLLRLRNCMAPWFVNLRLSIDALPGCAAKPTPSGIWGPVSPGSLCDEIVRAKRGLTTRASWPVCVPVKILL